MKNKFLRYLEISNLYFYNKSFTYKNEWKTLVRRIINKGFDADKLHIVINNDLLGRIIKTTPIKRINLFQVGKIVQINKGFGINNTDQIIIELPNGQLISHSNCAYFLLDSQDEVEFIEFYKNLEKNVNVYCTRKIINNEDIAKLMLTKVKDNISNLYNKKILY